MTLGGPRERSVFRDRRGHRLEGGDPPLQPRDLAGVAGRATRGCAAGGARHDRLWLSNAAAPCALFLLGVTVALRPLGRMPAEVPTLVVIKLVIHPLLVWLLLSALGDFDPTWIFAAVVMAALPPALNIFVIATQYDTGVERASACVLVGTLVSMVTLTGFLWFIRTGRMSADLFPS
jgi:hypothetical protein